MSDNQYQRYICKLENSKNKSIQNENEQESIGEGEKEEFK